jgi:hypothetical protein
MRNEPTSRPTAKNGNGRTTSARTPSGQGVVNFGRLEPKQSAARNGNSTGNRTPNPKPTAASPSKQWYDDGVRGNKNDPRLIAAGLHRLADSIYHPDMDGASRSRAAKQGATQSRNGTNAPPAKTPAKTPVKGASKARNGGR